jgi:hypothetical protein
MSSEYYFKSCAFFESEGWFTLETRFCAFIEKNVVETFLRYTYTHALLQRYSAPPLLEQYEEFEAEADLSMRKALCYVSACAPFFVGGCFSKKGAGALDAQVAPASLPCGVPCHAGFIYLCF